MTLQTVHFKKQMLDVWRITDSDGKRQVTADQAFKLMQELVEDGWRLQVHEATQQGWPNSILAVTMTKGG